VIEPDFISTKDGVLIARHDPNLATSTDVASRPEFADRKRVDWQVDGEKQTGWFAHDFTLAEIKTLGTVITDLERPQENNGKFRVATMQEIFDLVKTQSAKLGRTIYVYLRPRTRPITATLGSAGGQADRRARRGGWNSRSAPVFVQSFEPGSLKEMRSKG